MPSTQTTPGAERWTATGLETQVFLDPSGRRAWLVRSLGGLLAALAVVFPAALVSGASGFDRLPAPPAQFARHNPIHAAPVVHARAAGLVRVRA
jgi:hypothetical protein